MANTPTKANKGKTTQVKDTDYVHKMLPDGYQEPPDDKVEVLDFDVESAKVYTPDELRREIARIASSKD